MNAKLNNLNDSTWEEMHSVIRKYLKADDVGMWVGFVLGFLLFGLVGGCVYSYLPQPANLWVGGAFWVAGAMLIAYLIFYLYVAKTRSPHAMEISVGTVLRSKSVYGGSSDQLILRSICAFRFSESGKGNELKKFREKPLKRLIANIRVVAGLQKVAKEGASTVIVLCVPNGQIVAALIDGEWID